MDLPFACQQGKLLSEVCTFGIGGPARYFAEASTCQHMQEMLTFADKNSLPFFILGKGSNTLFDDRGYNGLVILNKIDYLKPIENGVCSVGAGYGFARLGSLTARQGFSGLEFACGIPATVGGAIYMNAGANGRQTADALHEVSYVTHKGELIRFNKNELHFGYRKSSFQQWQGAIVEAVFHLHSLPEAKIAQKKILEYRLKTQPYGEKSAGCAFRNPVGGGAGQLIDRCGLKGIVVGGATVSPLHANFIINTGGAKAQDVLDLMHTIKEQVYNRTGVVLEEEIRFIPYDN